MNRFWYIKTGMYMYYISVITCSDGKGVYCCDFFFLIRFAFFFLCDEKKMIIKRKRYALTKIDIGLFISNTIYSGFCCCKCLYACEYSKKKIEWKTTTYFCSFLFLADMLLHISCNDPLYLLARRYGANKTSRYKKQERKSQSSNQQG